LIVEGILTTSNEDGTTNVSPMGPLVDEALRSFTLRPFCTSKTFANLKRTGEGVFHVTDDVELLARAAVSDRLDPMPDLVTVEGIGGKILAGACRWYALRVTGVDESEQRATVTTEVLARGVLREFFGLNRARHAVVEAAILATRTALLPADQIQEQFDRLAVLVDKTGGPAEHRAFEFLREYVRDAAGRAAG
jgi:hypothetical protein